MKGLSRIRPLNILIVLATQLLVYVAFVLPISLGDLPGIEYPPFYCYFIIALITCIVTIGGYIINDIYDIEIDKINKPDKVMLNPVFWNQVYKVLFVIGLILVLFLSYQLSNIFYTPIYILAWLILQQYSKRWKCKVLIGNVVVALLSSLSVLTVLAPAFSIYLTYEEETFKLFFTPLIYYTLMAFMISLLREMVKDIEDVEGDKKNACKTLAVQAGIVKSKVYTQFLQLTTIVFSLMFAYVFFDMRRHIWVGFIFFLILLLVYQMYKLNVGQDPKDFRSVQKFYKLLMVIGILVFLVEPYFGVGI